MDCEDVHRSRLVGLRGVRVGEASNPGTESGHEVRVEDFVFVDPTQVDRHEEVICVSNHLIENFHFGDLTLCFHQVGHS